MKRLPVGAALGLVVFLTVGCGAGAATFTCPGGKPAEKVQGSNFAVPYAEDGHVCLTREPFGGLPFLGEYKYDDLGTPGEPVVELRPEGQTSYFQAHGVTKRTIEWGVAIDPEGHPLGEQNEFGARVHLFFKYTGTGMPACPPGVICDSGDTGTIDTQMGTWQVAPLSMFTDPDTSLMRMGIAVERYLECADATGPCSLPVTPEFTWSN